MSHRATAQTASNDAPGAPLPPALRLAAPAGFPALPAGARGSAASTAMLDTLLLVVPGLIWGASFLFIAEGLRAIGPWGLTFARIAVGFATLALFPASRRPLARRAPAGRFDALGIAALGVLWFAFPLSMFPLAEQRVSSALAGMLNGAIPLCAALVAALLERRAPARGVMAGLAVGLGGAALVAWPTLGQGRSSAAGVAMILAALISYGVAVNLARPLEQRHGAMPVIWRAQAVALVLTAPQGLPELLAARWTSATLLALLALGALGTGIAYVLLGVAAGRVGATRASSTSFLIPGVALALGVLARGEAVPGLSVLGAGICLAGAWLIRRADSRAVHRRQEES